MLQKRINRKETYVTFVTKTTQDYAKVMSLYHNPVNNVLNRCILATNVNKITFTELLNSTQINQNGSIYSVLYNYEGIFLKAVYDSDTDSVGVSLKHQNEVLVLDREVIEAIGCHLEEFHNDNTEEEFESPYNVYRDNGVSRKDFF